MSTIEFLFSEPSAMFERLSAPKRTQVGRYLIDAHLSVQFDAGDATIARLDAVLPLIAEVSDRLMLATADDPVHAIQMSATPRDQVRLKLSEADPLSGAEVEDGAEIVATAAIRKIAASIDGAGASVTVVLRFEVRADQVAELVRLLGATRAAASSVQLDLGLSPVPDLAVVA